MTEKPAPDHIRGQGAEERRIEAVVRSLARRLDLGWLHIANKYLPAALEDDARVACVAKADWEYRQVSLRWCLPVTMPLDKSRLTAVALHELVHALNAPVWESLTEKEQERLYKLNELSTENVTRALLALLSLDGDSPDQ